MRTRTVVPSALAALALFISASALRADPARELVVCLMPAGGGARAALVVRFETRCAALGLRVVMGLADGLPAAPPDTRTSRTAAAPAPDPFDLDPARVMLVEAPSPAAARAAQSTLAVDPLVAWVEPNAQREPAVEWLRAPESRMPFAPGAPGLDPAFPDDPLFRDTRQWGLRNVGPAGVYGGAAGADIRAPEAWALSTGSNDVRLGVADTGIDPAHPDLAGSLPDGSPRIEPGFNATQGPVTSVIDLHGHGTPVTGVMAARTNDGVHFDSLGTAGVCGGDGRGNLGCRIVPIKITRDPSGLASSFDIARAIHYATRVGCRALNLSYAGDVGSQVERAALHHAMLHDCVVVAAAGNRGFVYGNPTQPQYPAAYAADGLCVQVGATDPFDRRAPWSSYGPGLDVVAPGVDIWTTFMTYPSEGGASYPGYVAASGTSFAAPFVTGTIGLLAAARPDLAGSDVQPLLRASADDVGAPGVDAETGWGRLNAAAALARVAPGIGLWHDEAAATRFRPLGVDSVRVDGDAPPAALEHRGWHPAERVEVTATIAIPDSFAGAVEVWPRLGGTSTLRAAGGPLGFTPWAEVSARGARTATLRGYLYRLTDAAEDAWLPVPPDQARFGFTVIGRVRRAGDVTGGSPRAGVPRLRAAPNPFRARTVVSGPAGAAIAIADVGGRVVRRGRVDGAGAFAWDGFDGRGRRVPPGLYFAREERAGAAPAARLVRIE
jgi:subtilisin family serine protease